MEKEHRLFLKNLPSEVSEDQIAASFSGYGTLGKIEIKQKNDASGNSSKFAFVHITTNERGLNQCFQDNKNLVINGTKVNLQVAKESFLARLQREREAGNTTTPAVPKFIKPDERPAFAPDDLKLRISKPRDLARRSVPISVEPAEPESKYSKSLSKPVAITPTEKKLAIQESLRKNNATSGKTAPEKSIEQPVRVVNKQQAESESKRLKSLHEKKKAFKDKGALIREALSAVDSKANAKKIVFDDDLNEVVESSKETKGTKRLFDDDQDDEGGIEDGFKIRDNVDEKLQALQSGYSNDKRFKLDKRFLENEDEEVEKVEEAESGPREERDWQLEILQNVLGKPVKISHNDNVAVNRKSAMIRYDPMLESHHAEPQKPIKNASAKKNAKKLKETVPSNDTVDENPIPTSKDIFFDVADNLVDTLKPDTGFSLLKTFGNNVPARDDADARVETRDKIQPKFTLDSKNPFKYDSSDNESGQEDNAAIEAPKDNARSDWNDSLFFRINDPRFQDAEKFFNGQSESSGEFPSLRRTLKQIVRSKVQNNLRKKATWRKKKSHK